MAGGLIGWVEDRLKPVKNLFKNVGLTKDNLNKIAPFISVVNPILGGTLTVLTADDKAQGIQDALTSIVLGNVINGNKNLLNLSAAGRHTNLTNAVGNMLQNPKDLVTNVLSAGGDIKAGTIATLGGSAGTLLSGIPGVENIIQGGQLNLGAFGLDDALGIYSLIETLKSKPPEVPDAFAYAMIDDDMKTKILSAFNSVIDDQTEKNLKYAQETYNSRGLWRSLGPDMLTGAESDINVEAGKAKANKQTEIDMSALQYNNELKSKMNQDALQKYGLEQGAEASRIEGISELAGDWLAGKGALPSTQQVPQTAAAQSKQLIDAILSGMDVGGVNQTLPTPNVNNNVPQVNSTQTQAYKDWVNGLNLDTSLPNDDMTIPDIQLKA